MAVGTSVPVVVFGPADLLVTALLCALRARGLPAERIRHRDSVGERVIPPAVGRGVLVIDVDLPDAGSVVSRAVSTGWTVLAIGTGSDRERAAAAVVAGAAGWIDKSGSLDTLVDAVRAATTGRLRMSPHDRAEWIAVHRRANDSVAAQVQRLERLTRRELEVLGHLADGLRAVKICEVLFVSMPTVRTHIRAILGKLGVHSQAQAATVYRETTRRMSQAFTLPG